MRSPISLYVVAFATLIAVAALDAGGAAAASRSAGALTPLATPKQPAMDRIRDLAFDAAGRHLYAVGAGSRNGQPVVHASLVRNAGTGSLGALRTGTCSTIRGATGRGCRTPAQVEISADGRAGYVVGDYHGSAAVAILRRSRNGALAATNRALRALGKLVRAIALSPNGRQVYVAVDRTVVVLDRDRRGNLTRAKGYERCHADHRGCPGARGIVRAGGVALSRNGRSLYVTSENGVAVFRRSLRTGALRQLAGQAGCIAPAASDGCAPGLGVGGSDGPAAIGGKISARRIVVSGDGARVYAASAAGIAVFARSAADGSLRQLPGPAGCVSSIAYSGCTPARALLAVGAIALSADSSTLYATTTASRSLAVLRRTGAGLAQLAGRDGCANATGADGCMAVAGSTRPFAIAVSPDDRHVYAGSYDGALLTFSR